MDTNLQAVLTDFLKRSNVPIIKVNSTNYFDKKLAVIALINSIEDALRTSSIKGTNVDLAAYKRYAEANEIGLPLFINPKQIEFECNSRQSFAMTRIICENFGFDVPCAKERIRGNNKELFQQFLNLIDFLDVSSGAKPTEISVTFTVNDIWLE